VIDAASKAIAFPVSIGSAGADAFDEHTRRCRTRALQKVFQWS